MSKKLICHITATKSIQTFVVALCKTLKLCKVINEKAVVKVAKDSNIKCICVYLENASIHEQTLFNTAIKEFFSRITEPKYALVKKNMFKANIYEMSFACPNEICKKKKYAENLAKCLKTSTANFGVINIKGKKGKEELLQCRRSSYLTFGSAEVGKRYKVYGE